MDDILKEILNDMEIEDDFIEIYKNKTKNKNKKKRYCNLLN